MLTEGHARSGVRAARSRRACSKEVLPEIDRMHGVEQPPQYHPEGDVWVHTMLLLEKLPAAISRTLAWGTLLHDVGKPPTFRVAPDRIRFDGHVEVGVRMAEEICRRLHFSNEDTEQIVALVANHMRFADAGRMKESTLKRFMRLPEIRRAPGAASHGLPEQSRRPDALQFRPRAPSRQVSEEEIGRALLLYGEDLIAMGYRRDRVSAEILSVDRGRATGGITAHAGRGADLRGERISDGELGVRAGDARTT